MNHWTRRLTSLLLLAALPTCTHTSSPTASSTTPLIPRKVFFENPTRVSPKISPDGKWLAYAANHEGVMNIWVTEGRDLSRARLVTHDKREGIRSFRWDYKSRYVIYRQDEGGDENYHIFAVDVRKGTTRDLTPYKNVQANINSSSPSQPDEIVVGLNDRDPQAHDLYRIRLDNGQRTLLAKNDQGFQNIMVDDTYQVRIAQKNLPDGSAQYLVADQKNKWAKFLDVPFEDVWTTSVIDLDKGGKNAYALQSMGRDTSALVSIDLASKKMKVLAEDARADINDTLMHPTSHEIQAASYEYARTEWKIFDESIKKDWEALTKVSPGEFYITSRTLDDRIWTVAYVQSNGPWRYYIYDRNTQKADFLLTNRPNLEAFKMPAMQPITITARDGLKLVSYLTVPIAADPDGDGRPDRPLPLVLLVHGGPWSRDSLGYDATHQWLANRGYAVLSVNFRGSTGLGKKFLNAGNYEWAGRMQDDLLDAVDWAIQEKIADPAKVASMGTSYGGYATLVGLTFTPDRFACGVDISGPSNIETLLKSAPPYWKPMIAILTQRVGDTETEAGRKLLFEKSPLHRAGAIKKPLLIGHGVNDPKVKQAEADQIVKAMQDKKLPVTYVVYPDEGHGFGKPQNQLSFNAVAETFLGTCLGGRVEPIGKDLAGSSLQVPTGAEEIPGLEDALKQR